MAEQRECKLEPATVKGKYVFRELPGGHGPCHVLGPLHMMFHMSSLGGSLSGARTPEVITKLMFNLKYGEGNLNFGSP